MYRDIRVSRDGLDGCGGVAQAWGVLESGDVPG